MILKVDFQSDIPIYQQLKTQILTGIATNSLRAGDPLPSVRQMASDLGINLHTVNKTYTVLKQEGFITVHRQKGVVINELTGRRITEEYLGVLLNSLNTLTAEAFCRGMPEEEFKQICSDLYKKYRTKAQEVRK